MNTTVDDFDNIGRKIPYRVPEGYFDTQRDRLLEIGKSKKSGKILLRKVIAVSSAAVVILALSLLCRNIFKTPTVTIDPVEAYLSNLSDEDLAQAIDIADYDIFYETDSLTNY